MSECVCVCGNVILRTIGGTCHMVMLGFDVVVSN